MKYQVTTETYENGSYTIPGDMTLSLEFELAPYGAEKFVMERDQFKQDFSLLVWFSAIPGGTPRNPQLHTSFLHLTSPAELVVAREIANDEEILESDLLDAVMAGTQYLNIQNLSGSENGFTVNHSQPV